MEHNPSLPSQSNPKGADKVQIYGITEELINSVKSFTIDTFKDFPLQVKSPCWRNFNHFDKDSEGSLPVARKTCHPPALKRMSQLRYMLCPRHLKEKQFWRIYFKLVKSHVLE